DLEKLQCAGNPPEAAERIKEVRSWICSTLAIVSKGLWRMEREPYRAKNMYKTNTKLAKRVSGRLDWSKQKPISNYNERNGMKRN
ncbi:MAG: hypothetical protein IIX88_02430, partial [Firmicutes bacterium]|nr:hypothetical protein [Bacillota bacterium]